MHIQKSSLQPLLARCKSAYAISKTHTLILAGRFRRFCTRRRLTYILGGAAGVLFLAHTINFYIPRSVAFSYAQPSCFTSPTVLPGLARQQRSTHFDATYSPSLKIGSIPLYSHTTCVTAIQAPKEKAAESIALTLPGVPILKKNITIKTSLYPALKQKPTAQKPLSTKDPLAFTLATSDHVFTYRIEANGRHAACHKKDKTLLCDIPKLGLAQATPYTVTLQRLFKDKPVSPLFTQTFTTVEPVQVIDASVTQGQTIYDIPTEMVVILNKPIESLENVQLQTANQENKQSLPIAANFKDNAITITLTQPLPRSTPLVLSIGAVSSADGGYLSAPFNLAFATSGGPKVKGVNIGSAKVQPGGSIVITFDSPVAANQNLGEFIRVEASGAVAATLSVAGNRVTVRPNELARCTPFTVKVLDGLKNEYGVTGGSAWQFKSRVLCQTVFSIGTSVKGRGITAYRFGTGAQKIVFVGGTHGDEKSSVYILNQLVEQLELNPGRIPAHQTVVVIPNLNPDGYALGRRTNANNVDLNRNFPSSSWKSGVIMPDKSYNPTGGGTAPLSEPESAALANYMVAQNPRLVLTYHAAAGVVIPNDSGDSVSLAQTYDQKSNVGFASNSQTGAIFAYDTTGAFEDWLHDKRGTPALLIELWTKSGNEYSKHQNALWHMIGL